MPVARSDPRRAIIIALGAIVAAGTLVFLVVALGGGLGNDEPTPFGSDDPEFQVGDAEAIAAEIDGDGPITFPDVATGRVPIWVNHIGQDPEEGWVAFDAIVGDECRVNLDQDRSRFVDCQGRTYPADGGDLPHYDVRVEEGDVIVDLNPDDDP
ncbi:MAG: hypothetical protein ACRD0U_15025 [Acidimicrobiales bacterium]